ncbi:hypothetical protein BofuT4_uP027670.1 [Botrytis cinerea T4]|uniref:Uncharacterized protein n=1 Tax=Botryotinia fuckeliana (strain T4) TaxID=999810 RepID=G2YA20_BOTF4|nr:hypothetical protein BofuT4_uP027670.1 [Botrytis cinerea T4]
MKRRSGPRFKVRLEEYPDLRIWILSLFHFCHPAAIRVFVSTALGSPLFFM